MYTESVWTGKKTLTVGGSFPTPLGKNRYMIGGEEATLVGNAITGVHMQVGEEKIWLIPKPKWYETLLAFLPFILIMVWGNSPELCAILPMVGGAVGGAVGGVFMVISVMKMRSATTVLKKILTGLALTVAAIFCAHVIALLFLLLLY